MAQRQKAPVTPGRRRFTEAQKRLLSAGRKLDEIEAGAGDLLIDRAATAIQQVISELGNGNRNGRPQQRL